MGCWEGPATLESRSVACEWSGWGNSIPAGSRSIPISTQTCSPENAKHQSDPARITFERGGRPEAVGVKSIIRRCGLHPGGLLPGCQAYTGDGASC